MGYCMAKGWQVAEVIKEVGSGVNDNRKRLLKVLADSSITLVVVEHKDRLTRFGFNYIQTLLETQGRRVEVVNLAEDGDETSFRGRFAGGPGRGCLLVLCSAVRTA